MPTGKITPKIFNKIKEFLKQGNTSDDAQKKWGVSRSIVALIKKNSTFEEMRYEQKEQRKRHYELTKAKLKQEVEEPFKDAVKPTPIIPQSPAFTIKTREPEVNGPVITRPIYTETESDYVAIPGAGQSLDPLRPEEWKELVKTLRNSVKKLTKERGDLQHQLKEKDIENKSILTREQGLKKSYEDLREKHISLTRHENEIERQLFEALDKAKIAEENFANLKKQLEQANIRQAALNETCGKFGSAGDTSIEIKLGEATITIKGGNNATESGSEVSKPSNS